MKLHIIIVLLFLQLPVKHQVHIATSLNLLTPEELKLKNGRWKAMFRRAKEQGLIGKLFEEIQKHGC